MPGMTRYLQYPRYNRNAVMTADQLVKSNFWFYYNTDLICMLPKNQKYRRKFSAAYVSSHPAVTGDIVSPFPARCHTDPVTEKSTMPKKMRDLFIKSLVTEPIF